MGKPQFGYWNLRGLGQSVRFVLHYMGVDYEEVVYLDKEGDETWTKAKPTLGMESPNVSHLNVEFGSEKILLIFNISSFPTGLMTRRRCPSPRPF